MPTPVTPLLRALSFVSAALVIVTGIQLYVLSGLTPQLFAWTINPPVTAAFLGAGYFASALLILPVARGASWPTVRASLVAIWAFTTLTLVVSLIHIDRFHFASPLPVPVFAAWAWFAVYLLFPVAFGFALLREMRRHAGPEVGPAAPLPQWFRLAFVVQTLVFAAIGLALLVAPAAAELLWPWKLTPLTARAAGAWMVAYGVIGVAVARENDRAATFGPMLGWTALGVLQLIALLRFAGEIDWGHRLALPYVFIWITVVVLGLAGLRIARS